MKKAGDIILVLFRDNFGPEFMETARTTAGLFSSWTEVVSEVWPSREEKTEWDIPAAAVHSRIRDMERGILLVEADHPGWVQILQTKQRALLASARRRFPELNIRSIAFRLSRDSIAPPTGSPPLEKTPLEKKTSENTAAIAGVSALPPKPAVSEITPEDDEFYAAMKELELVLKKRNGLT